MKLYHLVGRQLEVNGFTKKTWADGTVEHYKARLVAQGFTQNVWYGLYDKTFCPVVRLESLHATIYATKSHVTTSGCE